ncbi:ABC transporter ATP-binding protein [Treponema sp. OMZ 840]|uniref:ABC transporter ATP-binding protein n=1 Tax=Treponema sp. OMZ 840 TaxID=244313 RepID=UPI003D94F37E
MTFEVQNGRFSYGGQKNIIDNISFTLHQGKVLSVLGPNGVGKTTLLKCLMGLLKWNSGCTLLDGKNIRDYSPKEFWSKVAYVPQAKQSTFAYTALEMVTFGRSAHLDFFRQPTDEDRRTALACMKDIGIDFLQNKLCSEMSGGELQMVLIARALAANPQLLVLDEPESNLDFKNQLTVLDTIKDLSRTKNISVIVNTHYPDHAIQIADSTVILKRNGECLYGDTARIINEANLIDAFNVKVRLRDVLIEEETYTCVIPVSA